MTPTPLPLSAELLGPTYRMTMEQLGAYVTLLKTQWLTRKPVPGDIRSMIFLFRTTTDRWLNEIQPALLPHFRVNAEGWWHERLDPDVKLITCGTICDRDGRIIGTVERVTVADQNLFGEPICDTSAKKLSRDAEFGREFEDTFWPAYPIKQGKQPALNAFVKARRKTGLDVIMAGLARYKESLKRPNPPSTKYAQGWLNDQRWNDQFPDVPAQTTDPRQLLRPPINAVGSAPAYGTAAYAEMLKKIGA